MNFADQNLNLIAAIALAALFTYSLRVGGLLLAEKMPKSRKFRKFMEALPGTILLSLVAPGIFSSGLGGIVAAGGTALVAWKTKNLFIALAVGMAVIIIWRNFIS